MKYLFLAVLMFPVISEVQARTANQEMLSYSCDLGEDSSDGDGYYLNVKKTYVDEDNLIYSLVALKYWAEEKTESFINLVPKNKLGFYVFGGSSRDGKVVHVLNFENITEERQKRFKVTASQFSRRLSEKFASMGTYSCHRK